MKNSLEYIKSFYVATPNVDFSGKATVQTLLQFFQEIAWEHAEELNLGFEDLLKNNLIWVLSRQKVKILDLPKWQQSVKVKTWATGKDRLFWNRDFIVYDKDGNELARAASAWLIINIETRRPFRDEKLFNIPVINPEFAFNHKLEKIPEFTQSSCTYEKEVRYTDLDLNDHVNNVKYLEWVLDSYNLDFYKKNKIETLELNYLAEANWGDKIRINSDFADNIHFHNVNRISDKKELFRVKIEWQKK